MKTKKMKYKSGVAAAAVLSLMAINPAASRGAEGTGVKGGDPRVVEFLQGAKYVCGWLSLQPSFSRYSGACRSEVSDIEDSVNHSDKRKPRLVFVPEKVTESSGAEKDVVTSTDRPRMITGNIGRWDNDSFPQRMTTIAIEMSVLLDIPPRYNVGEAFASTSMFGTAGLSLPLENLPLPTRLIAAGPVSMPANSRVIEFSDGQEKTVPEWVLQPSADRGLSFSLWLGNLDPSGCIFMSSNRSDNSRSFRELDLTDHDGDIRGWDIQKGAFQAVSPYSPDAQHLFFCWNKDHGYSDPKDQGGGFHLQPTIGDLLGAVGSQFYVVLPDPQTF